MNDILYTLQKILRRLVRLETKVAKLMEHNGLAADGRGICEPKELT